MADQEEEHSTGKKSQSEELYPVQSRTKQGTISDRTLLNHGGEPNEGNSEDEDELTREVADLVNDSLAKANADSSSISPAPELEIDARGHSANSANLHRRHPRSDAQ